MPLAICGGVWYNIINNHNAPEQEGNAMQDKMKLPIGMEDFQKLRTGDFYYVDKTMFIYDLMQYRGDVNLFTRPRRFGKTLNIQKA